MTRTLIVCPGRGSYTSSTHGWIGRFGAFAPDEISRADARRAARGESTLSDLDGAARFDAKTMLSGANAAGLTFLSSVADLARLDPEKVEPVAVLGNSMGWYTALYAAGALDFDDGLELIETMGGMQSHGSGSQLVYPLVDEKWCADVEALERVEQALAKTGALWSIRLGGLAVLAGPDDVLDALESALPTVQLGRTSYPYRLKAHAAYHTPLMADASRRGQKALAGLGWRTPTASLIDGTGRIHRPGVASPRDLQAYTLGAQVVETFDFTRALEVGLKAFGPEQLLLLGPGASLGGAVAQVLIANRWQGLTCRAELDARQASDSPLVISLGREEQAAQVVRDPSTD
jgi:acyl transferase domain-containing protein